MLERLSTSLTRWCLRWIPDGYVIAGLLALLLVLAALAFGDEPPRRIVVAFGEGFWGFIPFTLQMAMVLLTGFIVAEAPPVKRGLLRLAAWPGTARGAVALVAVVSMSLAWVNWGLSIVGAGLLARRIAERRLAVDYRLLVASAYLGLGCVWHAGLSSSAALTSSDPAQKFVKAYLGEPVPVTETIFAPFNLILTVVVIAVMTGVAVALHPKRAEPAELQAEQLPPPPDVDLSTPAAKLENSPLVNLVLSGLLLGYLPLFLADQGLERLNINHVNLLFFGLGALLHWRPRSFLRAAELGGRQTWGVLLQFGIYAALAGVLDVSGLADALAHAFTTVASAETFPALVVLYSGALNYLVPSGGAKWFIEVQYLAAASKSLGVPMGTTIVAYAWGDMLTNIIQPFWAIPLLAVARLGFRDIMGYCLLMFFAYAAVVVAAFGVWGAM